MNSDQLVYCLRVPSKNKTGIYRIKTVWDGQTFILTILDNLNAFQTKVSLHDLTLLSTKYERDLPEYIQLLKNSMSELNTSYIYNRQDNIFYIYKQEKPITIQLADFTLEKINYNDAITEFIDEISILADLYKKQILTYKAETLKAIEQKDDYAQKIENYIIEKQNSEHELYSKFMLILNEKKMRIQYLQEMLESFEAGRSVKINGNRLETISDSETDSSNDESAPVTHQVQIEMTPKKRLDFLDDDDEKTITVLPKRIKISPVLKDLDEILTVANPDVSIPNGINIPVLKPEVLKPLEKIEEGKENSDDTFELSTQDLYDRL